MMDSSHSQVNLAQEGLRVNNRPPLRGSGSYPTMIRARTANRKISKRSESITITGAGSVSLERTRSNSKKRKRMVYSRVSRRKSLENLGLLIEKKETDVFELLPEGCLKVRQLSVRGRRAGKKYAAAREVYYEKVEQRQETRKPSVATNFIPGGEGHPAEDNRRNVIDWKNKRNISVIVRIRPKQSRELENKAIIFRMDSNTIVFDPKEKTKDFYFQGVKQLTRNDFGRKRPNRNMSFRYDKVYGPESTNKEIFMDSLGDLTNHLIDGYNCTVFAYGATGSGKTYTMIGSPSNPGLTVLMVESLYKRIGEIAQDYESELVVSYLEVYNETIKDLLRPEKELSIREDGKKGIIIPELTYYKPRGPSELLKLLRSGNRARTQHATDLNSESSRSHAVFEVKLSLKKRKQSSSSSFPRDPLENQHEESQPHHDSFPAPHLLPHDDPIEGGINKVEVIHSKLVMVDLAGSERGAAAGNLDGARQREGASINKSLLALANCISALADGKCHIPYRNSKLTRLLKDALSGNCTTVMIANISPSAITSEDTYNTLKYADRAKSIVGPGSKQNVFLEDLIEDGVKSQVAELQAKVLQLEELLEEEKLKHEVMAAATSQCGRSKREQQQPCGGGGMLGEGDGPQTGRRNSENQEDEEPSVNKGSTFIISDSTKLPNEIKKYIDTAAERGRVFSKYVAHAKEATLNEWTVLSRKLRADMAEFFTGRLQVTDEKYVDFAKLKNEMGNIVENIGALNEEPDKDALELRNLSEKMENYLGEYVNSNLVEREQESSAPNLPSAWESERKTLVTIRLDQYLLFKRMLGEADGNKKVEQFYHTFCQQINNHLITSGVTLMQALKLVKSMYSRLESTNELSTSIREEYKQVLDAIYGLGLATTTSGPGGNDGVERADGIQNCINNSQSSVLVNKLGRRGSQVAEDFNNLRKLVERPLCAHLNSSDEMVSLGKVLGSSPLDGIESWSEKMYEPPPSTGESSGIPSTAETLYRRRDTHYYFGDDSSFMEAPSHHELNLEVGNCWGMKSSKNQEPALVSKTVTNRPNPNPLQTGGVKPDITSRRSKLMPSPPPNHHRHHHLNNNSFSSNKSLKVLAKGESGGGAIIRSTSPPEYPMSQGQKSHHQRLKVNPARKSMPIPPHSSKGAIDLTSEARLVNHHHHHHHHEGFDETEPIITKKYHHHLPEISSGRSSMSHKRPYTNCKTFTISRETVPTGNIPVISSPASHAHAAQPSGSDSTLPSLELAEYSSNEEDEDDHDHENSSDESSSGSTGSYSENSG